MNGQTPIALSEALLERRERQWRRKHFASMSEAQREAHAQTHRIYETLSRSAEREGHAVQKLARYRLKRPKPGWSAPDSPYVKLQRYPRQKATRAWLRILAGLDGSKREIVTAADRQRRQIQRVAKGVLRVADRMAQSQEGLAALELILARAKLAMAV